MNPSSTTFDSALREIQHFQSYPSMLPYVGEDYETGSHRKMLLVGESFYFPEESTVHLDAERWYSQTESALNCAEIEYFGCRGLVECPWKADGHKMYREINGCLATLGLEFKDRPVSHVAYINAYFRPASKNGDSFKHGCTLLDRTKSWDITERVIRAIKPDLVVYVSKYAWDNVGRHLASRLEVPEFRFTSHPADPRHWNRRGYAHGRSKFIQILQDDFMRPLPQ